MERLLWAVFALMLLPLGGFCAVLWITTFLKVDVLVRLVASVAACLLVIACVYALILRFFSKLANLRLGWFGERVVADQLDVLKQKGYEIFHDVPCKGSMGSFNLDHVVVGNGIVVVVETKTRRKPKEKGSHKVSYCGQALQWPWGRSTRELDQVVNNAQWLRQEFKKNLNLDVTVYAALTIPGWYVIGGPPQAPVLVESYKRLAGFIEKRFARRMTSVETELASLHLHKLSSNVGYANLE
ncbi:nuclease-related domain-containing protein [Prosthecobacter debontii]|nr:nuclease-related domain-containing protein [Prosthecobacter debontii]